MVESDALEFAGYAVSEGVSSNGRVVILIVTGNVTASGVGT